MRERLRPVVLAGGGGTRLWPLASDHTPKHMLRIAGDEALLDATLRRVADPLAFLPPVIVCSAVQSRGVEEQLESVTLILEPQPRNSAPAIAAAALFEGLEAVLLVMPSDHYFRDFQPLLDAIELARPHLDDRIITFGLKPSSANTGYGYIVPGEPLEAGVLAVDRFVEKPAVEDAARLIQGGGLWNSGLFLMKARVALREFDRHAPDVLNAVRSALPQRASGSQIELESNAFGKAPNISFDHAIMEHSSAIAVIPVDVEWSDLGTWASIYDICSKDRQANVLEGNATAVDSSGCLIRSEGPHVVVIGAHDLVIVSTPDRVLVVPRDQTQRVKEAAKLAPHSQGPEGKS